MTLPRYQVPTAPARAGGPAEGASSASCDTSGCAPHDAAVRQASDGGETQGLSAFRRQLARHEAACASGRATAAGLAAELG